MRGAIWSWGGGVISVHRRKTLRTTVVKIGRRVGDAYIEEVQYRILWQAIANKYFFVKLRVYKGTFLLNETPVERI